ncbi:hypothetical protein JOF34_000200 [Microbacterium amylolyticum]|uniref:Uncharacterized protein n=1 Tax=Microbacterium amylolyticum TaxID=936337 RepID=A0ABS4ZEB6_9MICO|nr:hypothetical protein [Microbacterium amylolyticum]
MHIMSALDYCGTVSAIVITLLRTTHASTDLRT